MYKGFKVIDADSHMMEPDGIWDKYVQPEFRPWAPGGAFSKLPFPRRLPEQGFSLGRDGKPGPAYISDGEGGVINYAEAYKPYIDRQFDTKAFLMYMDAAGIDLMVLYPTAALPLTAVETGQGRQIMNPKAAAALERGYNNWVYDFCNQGEGRLMGAGGIDLRDAEAAAQEARRCVKELGMKALYFLPQPPLGIPPHDPYYDVLWGEIADLGVPVGVHGQQGSSPVGRNYWGTTFDMGRAATSFPMEEMLVCVSMIAGGVMERFPNLKVVFLESSVGWAPFWLWWLDDKWKQHSIVRNPETTELPSFYFKRQCWISGEPEEPGFRHCVEDGLEDNLVTATDFPHPEDINFPRAMDDFYDEQSKVLSKEQIQKILWDNPARLYNIS